MLSKEESADEMNQ